VSILGIQVSQRLNQMLEWICLCCGMILLIVWPLAGTIALRNWALVLGCLTSLVWLLRVKPKITFQMASPIICLLAVPAWLWLHYFFWPTDAEAQLYDLHGTWLRVILAMFMASGLGMMLAANPRRMLWIWLAMSSLALVTLGQFFLQVWHTHQWLIGDFRFPFKYKSAVVYFLMYPCLMAYGTLHYCFLDRNSNSQNGLRKLWIGPLVILLAVICWIDFISAHTLNGVLVAGFMGLVLLLILTMKTLRARKNKAISTWALFGSVVVFLVIDLTTFWQYDQKYERKLSNLVGDIQIAVQIDKYPQWRRDPQYSGPRNPSDETGRVVNESTYERSAWFIKGIQILGEQPLGSGFSHLAFRHFMQQEDANLGLYKTHSGWLDYALGLGLPGLFLTWLGMGLVAWRCRKALDQNTQFPTAFASIWVLAGIWVLWWPTEVSEREFIEYLFFITILLGAVNLDLSFRQYKNLT